MFCFIDIIFPEYNFSLQFRKYNLYTNGISLILLRVSAEYKIVQLGAVSLTYLSILKDGLTPIFSATLSYGKRTFHHKKTGVTFSIRLGKHRPSITVHIA